MAIAMITMVFRLWRWRGTRTAILVIVVFVLIEPTTVFVEFENVVGAFDGKAGTVGKLLVDLETRRIGFSLCHSKILLLFNDGFIII